MAIIVHILTSFNFDTTKKKENHLNVRCTQTTIVNFTHNANLDAEVHWGYINNKDKDFLLTKH